ncbi:phage tail length tape measure family protein [Chelativorans sp.]|uniref:phage tail length tape measure family protein n=1 Tax=Chelativorans sp. TaxID=2203393 RepID=UPI00281174FA|nr:phage tail length tape measure family protein [Chelativorans sp.]
MAVEAERLLAIFEARFASLEKAFAKARTDASKTFTAIEAGGTKAEKALQAVGSKGIPGVDRMNASLRTTRFETSNVAAQLQDISVQLAAGQSPFLIAIQQGSQLNQVLGQAGMRGALSTLGGAFTSLLSPVSLLTVGIIGLGGYAVQYFASLLTNSSRSEEAIQKQVDLIRQVAERWGAAVPALQEYVDKLDEAKQRADAAAAGENLRARLYEPLLRQADDLVVAASDFASILQDYGAESTLIDELMNAFHNLRSAIQNNTATTSDTDRAQAALNGTMALGVGDAASLADGLQVLAGQLAAVAEDAAEADRQIAKVTRRSSTGGRVRYNPNAVQLPAIGPIPDRRPNDIERLDAEADLRDRQARSRTSSVSDIERERKAVADLISQLEFERSLIGMTNVEREQANALRRAGAAATPEQRARIEELTATIYNETAALQQQQQAYDQLRQIGTDAINGIATAFADGKIEAQEMIQIVLRLIQQLITMKSIGGLSAGIGGGFGNFLADLVGIPSYARGTNNHPGGLAWVGEKGRELVNLPRGSQVIPNHELGGGMVYSPSIVIDARGAEAGVEAKIRLALKEYSRHEFQRFASNYQEGLKRGVVR